MTVSSTTRTAGPFTGNGVQTDFPFTMRVFTDTDIVAAQTDTTGAVTTLALGSHYTVAINSNQRDNPGGTLTMLAPLDVDYLLDLTTSLEATQGARLTNAGGFYPEVVENALDKLTILHQQSTTNKDQVLRFPFPETVDEFPSPADRAGKIVAFDATGGLSLLAPTSGDATDLALTLSGSGGSDEIGFTHGGAGSVDMTVQEVLRERVNVKRLGVTIDSGTADNTSAWQTILGRSDVKGGLILEVPGGCTIKLSDELTIPAGVTIQGQSSVDKVYGTRTGFESPTMFWQSGAGKAVFVVGEGARDIALRDFALSAAQVPAAYTAPTSGKYGIRCHGEAPYSAYGLDFDRLGFYQFERAISVADDTPGTGTDWQCDSIKVKRCRFFSNLHGVYLNTINGDAIELDTCTFNVWTNGSGVYVKRSGYWSARNTYWVSAETAASVLATGAAGIYVADYQSDIIDIQNCQAEPGMSYFLKVDSTLGYETNEMPINIRSSLIEAPIQLDRKCRVLLDHCRASDNIVVAGDDVVMDYDLPLFIGGGAFSVTGARFKRIPRPAETGSTAGVLTATATTLFALPASAGTYEIACWLTGGGSLYATTARFLCDGTNLVKVGADAGANVTLSASSRNVQITQTSGATQTMQWSWRRLS